MAQVGINLGTPHWKTEWASSNTEGTELRSFKTA